MRNLIIILVCFIISPVFSQSWQIREGAEVTFSGKKAEGSFQGLAGTIQFNPDELDQAKFDVNLDASSIETGNNTKNKHARSENWFFVKEYPKIHFSSTSVIKTFDGYLLTGTLELRGIKKTLSFPFSFSDSGDAGEFSGSFRINRKDFGIEGNFMEFMVGDEFEVKVRVPVSQIVD
ncbi:MAG: YceI family protein [Cytophagales bacterium]|nr:YceI family protein [Cytophagales bacterium]